MSLIAHAGHGGEPMTWIHWVGIFHPMILHFPIVMIVIALIAEILNLQRPTLFYQNLVRFMLFGAAITAFLTIITGFAHGYQAHYHDETKEFCFFMHRLGGIATTLLAFMTAIFKELSLRKIISKALYGCTLIILFCFLLVTTYYGGKLTFGIGF